VVYPFNGHENGRRSRSSARCAAWRKRRGLMPPRAGAGTDRSPAREAFRPRGRGHRRDGAIAAAAIFLRFYDLAANPGGLYGDERPKNWTPGGCSTSPLPCRLLRLSPATAAARRSVAYVVPGVFNFAGATAVALRATAAAFGVAGVLAIGHWRALRDL